MVALSNRADHYIFMQWFIFFGPIAILKGHYFQPSLSVCLCLWPVLLPFNVNRFWRNLVTRTLLWSSLAATIMVQIGRRGTARCRFENFKKFSKITDFEFQNLVRYFLRLCLLCIAKKFDSIRTKLTEKIHFEVCPMAIPAMALLQQHDARRYIVIEPAVRRHAVIEARGHSELRAFGTGGVRNLGRNRAVKNPPACTIGYQHMTFH